MQKSRVFCHRFTLTPHFYTHFVCIKNIVHQSAGAQCEILAQASDKSVVLMNFFYFIKRCVQDGIQSSLLLLAGKMTLEKVVPLGHAVQLVLVLALTGTL